jgi:hypothetical protein
MVYSHTQGQADASSYGEIQRLGSGLTPEHTRAHACRYEYCFIFPLDLRGKRPQWVAARRNAQAGIPSLSIQPRSTALFA